MEALPFESFSYKEVEEIIFPKKENKIEIAWNMTFWCNYHCEYCYGKKNKKLPSKEELLKNAKKLNSYINNQNKKAHIRLIGGEVTFLPLLDVLKELNSVNIYKFSLTTNLSRDEDYFNNLIEYFKKNKYEYSITASLHLTQIVDLKKWIDKAKKIATTIQCTITNENCTACVDVLNNIKEDYNGNIKVDVCREKKSPIKLTNENLETIKQFFDTSNSYYNIKFSGDKEYKKVSKTEFMAKIDKTCFKGKKCISNKFRMLEDGRIFNGSCYTFLQNGEVNCLNMKELICLNECCPMCNILKVN